MSLGNTVGSLLGYPYPGAVIGSLVIYVYLIILVGPPWYFPVSSVGMLPEALLVNWAGSLIGILPGMLLETPPGLWFVYE